MPDSEVFEESCKVIEARTSFNRLEARGTVRLALKAAGLDSVGVDATQMAAVLRELLPKELAARGVADAASVCDVVAEAISSIAVEVSGDRVGAAASTMDRLGS